MTGATLHYIHDPLCGWCYGAAPLLRAAREVLPVVPHGGGMMAGGNRQSITPQLREFVMQHDKRIAQLTGQPFGPGYIDGLLRDSGAVLDSEPPITAMLAADELAGAGLDLLARMQKAHYIEGRRIAEQSVLVDLATEVGLNRDAFASACARWRGGPTHAHIDASRELLGRVGGRGFPSFALERDGRHELIDVGPHMAAHPQRAEQWKARLAQAAGESAHLR